MPAERLSKLLAHYGVASRRKSEEIVRSGRVEVNGVTVLEPHYKVVCGVDTISVDGRQMDTLPEYSYVALYKPVGYISDLADPRGRRIARQLIDGDTPLFPVGRLDYASEGLMIFTNDGEFANKVMHPSHEVEKEYIVKLSGKVTIQELNRLKMGVRFEGEIYRAKAATFLSETQRNTWCTITVTEGKNRMIRKMAEAISHPVLRLKRVRIDGIRLGRLRPGEFRYFKPDRSRH